MSLAQGNNTLTRPRIEPGSPDPESDPVTTRPVRPPLTALISSRNFRKQSLWKSKLYKFEMSLLFRRNETKIKFNFHLISAS